MLEKFLEDVTKALYAPLPPLTIDPGPDLKRSNAGLALKRCRAAWQRAYDAKADTDICRAEKDATNAYRCALPVLAGPECIRDFIACVAHGILIGVIPAQMSGQLLYAAQVATAALPRLPAPQKPARKLTPLPPTPPPDTIL
jgi:hypothetical protein